MQADLEQRLSRLEDQQALIDLKHRYCHYCDENYDPDALSDLFVEDATWDGGLMGHAHTRAGIHRYFSSAAKHVPFAIHHVTNPSITIDGNVAHCRWYLWQPMIMRDRNEALWYAALYEDECRKVDGRWLFQNVRITTRMLSPYSDGFAKTRILNLEGSTAQKSNDGKEASK